MLPHERGSRDGTRSVFRASFGGWGPFEWTSEACFPAPVLSLRRPGEPTHENSSGQRAGGASCFLNGTCEEIICLDSPGAIPIIPAFWQAWQARKRGRVLPDRTVWPQWAGCGDLWKLQRFGGLSRRLRIAVTRLGRGNGPGACECSRGLRKRTLNRVSTGG